MKIEFKVLRVIGEANVTLEDETVKEAQKRVEVMLKAHELSFHKSEKDYTTIIKVTNGKD